jgi:hypothetical protein
MEILGLFISDLNAQCIGDCKEVTLGINEIIQTFRGTIMKSYQSTKKTITSII